MFFQLGPPFSGRSGLKKVARAAEHSTARAVRHHCSKKNGITWLGALQQPLEEPSGFPVKTSEITPHEDLLPLTPSAHRHPARSHLKPGERMDLDLCHIGEGAVVQPKTTDNQRLHGGRAQTHRAGCRVGHQSRSLGPLQHAGDLFNSPGRERTLRRKVQHPEGWALTRLFIDFVPPLRQFCSLPVDGVQS